jgi:hypothetical protein
MVKKQKQDDDTLVMVSFKVTPVLLRAIDTYRQERQEESNGAIRWTRSDAVRDILLKNREIAELCIK